MTDWRVSSCREFGGELAVPGDKSISHRALMLLAISEEGGEVRGLLESADCLATLTALRALGAEIEALGPGHYRLSGWPRKGFVSPPAPLDFGNSGTGLRLMAGLVAGLGLEATLDGDASLRARPMERIVAPLRAMGAVIEARDGCPPLRLRAGGRLRGLSHELPVASAQVKSALLLAGLFAEGETRVREPGPSRDHSERMLAGLGCELSRSHAEIRLRPGRPRGGDIPVPGDLSSAAFFLAAAAARPGCHLRVTGVGVNPSRHGILPLLERMGAGIALENRREVGGEPVADISVTGRILRGIELDAADVALAIDEIPALLVAAAAAEGWTVIRGGGELRVKESDRIAAMVEGLSALGLDAREQAEGLSLHGGRPRGGRIRSHGDHRIAMAFAMLASQIPASESIFVENADNVQTSFPDFAKTAAAAGVGIEEC